MNNFEQWKKSLQNTQSEIKEVKNINLELNTNKKNVEELNQNAIKKDIKENNLIKLNKEEKKSNNDKINKKYIPKNIEEDKVQKIRNKFESVDNSDSDESNGYSNAKTEQNNHVEKPLKQKENPKEKSPENQLILKIKRNPK